MRFSSPLSSRDRHLILLYPRGSELGLPLLLARLKTRLGYNPIVRTNSSILLTHATEPFSLARTTAAIFSPSHAMDFKTLTSALSPSKPTLIPMPSNPSLEADSCGSVSSPLFETGVYYYFYQIFRDRAEATSLARQMRGVGDGSIGMFQSLIVAAFAGSVNVLLTNPIWVIVTRMQTHKKTSKSSENLLLAIVPDEVVDEVVEDPPYGIIDAVQELFGEAGLLGFWKGVLPTLIMVSNPSIQFMLYEALLKKLKKKRAFSTKDAEGLAAFEIFLLGAFAKLGATVVTYPLNVVKARLQAKQGHDIDRRHHYQGTWDAIRKMNRYEGLPAFYKGMLTKIMQSVFAAAVLFMVKEELVKALKLLLGNSRAKPSR